MALNKLDRKSVLFLELYDKSVDNAVILDMFLYNLFHIFFCFWGVPDIAWINDHRRPMSAGVEASSLIDPHLSF